MALIRFNFQFLCLILSFLSQVDSAKILLVYPVPAHSHFTLGLALANALISKGHNVTMIHPYSDKTPSKIRDISNENVIPFVEGFKARLFTRSQQTIIDGIKDVMELGIGITKRVFENKNIQKLMNSGEHFDLVIVEHFMNEALIGLGYHFKSPVIVLSSMDATMAGYLVGNTAPSSYVPNKFGISTSHMNFKERLQNFFGNVISSVVRETFLIPSQKLIFEKFITKDVPFESVIYNISLLLTNSHPSVTNPNPIQPNVIEIGGFHVTKPKKLPEDLQKFMDNAKDGVVLFSMGSNLKSADLSPQIRDAILTAFSKIKQQVLWKFETDLENVPKNVKIMKWLPQNDILSHPNIRVFITHGGLLSSIETIYHGVPVIGIPVFGDQKSNIASAVENGFALSVPLSELNQENLSRALNEILNNPKYRENAKRRSKLMLDRPLKPIDTAIYWIEYVIRNRGVPEFRSSAINLEWYQLYMIDIIAFLITITVLILIFCYAFIRKLLRFCANESKSKKNKRE